MGKNDICMSETVGKAMLDMRKFMFEHVYQNKKAKSEEGRAEMLVTTLYEYFLEHTDEMPDEFIMLLERGEDPRRVVCDYIACMTDRFAISKYEELFIPKTWHG